jgi:WW domain
LAADRSIQALVEQGDAAMLPWSGKTGATGELARKLNKRRDHDPATGAAGAPGAPGGTTAAAAGSTIRKVGSGTALAAGAAGAAPGASGIGGLSAEKSLMRTRTRAGSKMAGFDSESASRLLQRVARGFLARRAVRNWQKVVDKEDGDVYWFNAATGVSSWYPPGRDPDVHVDGTPKRAGLDAE